MEIVGISILSLMFTRTFEPLKKAKGWLLDRFVFLPFIHDHLSTVLYCAKCFSFWAYLIISQGDIINAALCSFIAYLLNHLIDRVESWYEG
tara:strand:+ start:3310 stop:3582 length:273 start_codon:yes stop_codon:yes gene_type:complete